MRLRIILAAGIVIALALCVYKFWPGTERARRQVATGAQKANVSHEDKSDQARLRMLENVPENAIAGLFIVVANDEGDLDAFLAAAQKVGLEVRKTVPEIGVALVAAADKEARAKLVACIPQRSSVEYDFISSCTDIADAPVLTGLEPLGSSPGPILGCPDDVNWGKGISLALLDMKVLPHPTLVAASIVQYAEADVPEGKGWHATAMASLVCGRGDDMTGVARSVRILNYTVMGNDGHGDTFSIVKGIVDAVGAGALVVCVQSATDEESRAQELAVRVVQADLSALSVVQTGLHPTGGRS